ncbi:hypothetical protein JMJ35_007379 [Cladonia borealis]|uniref:Cytochrome P450 n=1 Tax=Cladonia borealis TaxID=184061 RepID=A0AA39V7D5_9LECA|nr:hypothetical protein JMJ35_007379 [Cladonia borealis]
MSYSHAFICAALFSVLLIIIACIRRVYFHPLTKFPGPRTASFTAWYGFYFDVVKGGIGTKRFPSLHQRYGPIVRVAPDLLHIDDPDFFREVHGPHGTYVKSKFFYGTVGASAALLSLQDPHEHKVRRNVVNSLFSQGSVNALSEMAQEKIETAVRIIERHQLENKPLDIQTLYRCISADSITESMFGYSQELLGRRSDGDRKPPLLTCIDGFLSHLHLMTYFPLLTSLAQNLPAAIARRILPGYVEFREDCAHWIEKIVERRSKGVYTDSNGRTVMFDLLLEDNLKKGHHRLNLEELIDEALIFLTAGTDTTSYGLSAATFYVLHTPAVLQKLQEELYSVPRGEGGRIEWRYVQNLPYMAAIVKESLRLATPAIGVLPRVVPASGAHVQGQFIPGGTVILTTLISIHHNNKLFLSPERFIPERWLGEKGKELEKWFVPFSKGPRQCVGLNLAYMELYLTLANIFGRFDMQLWETDERCMQWVDHGAAVNASNIKVRTKSKVL